MRRLTVCVMAVTFALTALPASAVPGEFQRTAFSFKSAPGDFIGQGGELRLTPDSAEIAVDGDLDALTVSAITPGYASWWYATIAAPRGESLDVGYYANAERAAFRTGRAPGLDVYGDGRGCNEVFGKFWVNQIAADATGAIIRLDVRYVQHCESADAPPLRGRILYRAAPLSFRYVSEEGDFVGGGARHLFENATSTFEVTGDAEHLRVNVEGDREGWSIDLAPPDSGTLAEGAFEDAQRWPFAEPGHPQLAVFGNLSGCNELTGRFEIITIRFRPDGSVRRLHATFEQHCEGAGPALTGRIRFYS